jgi:hypothetical protein
MGNEKRGYLRSGIIYVDRVVLGYQLVHQPITVALEAVCIPAALPVVGYVIRRLDFHQRTILHLTQQIRSRDRIQVVRRQGGVVHARTVRGDLQAVQALAQGLHGEPARALVEGDALVGGNVAVDA